VPGVRFPPLRLIAASRIIPARLYDVVRAHGPAAAAGLPLLRFGSLSTAGSFGAISSPYPLDNYAIILSGTRTQP
jgi:hypothetical protein